MQPTMQKIQSTDTRKKKKHKKRKRGTAQIDVDNCASKPHQDTTIYDLSTDKVSSKMMPSSKLPSMGMSVIRQQTKQQTYSSGQQQNPLPTSTKSEKKMFIPSTRLSHHHGRRRRRHKSSEDEPHETTPSVSPSSTGRISDEEYGRDEFLDDNLSLNIQGNS